MSLTKDNSLTLMHYKEPLTKVEKNLGYGYYGAIQVTPDGAYIQCHMCGKLFMSLPLHLRQVHLVGVKDYRKFYKLARRTALVSEQERERCKMRTLKWINNMSPEKRAAWHKKRIAALQKWHRDNPKGSYKVGDERLEIKNKKGTCPDQLKDKIRKMAAKLGRAPRKSDFMKANGGSTRYMYMFKRTFGSFSKAVKAAGLEPQKKYVYREGKKTHYSDDELLDYLSIMWREQDKIPTESDFHRGLIPDPRVYRKRFGSMQRARELAGIQ